MSLGRSLFHVTIFGGICLASSLFPPAAAAGSALLAMNTEEWQKISMEVLKVIGSVTAGNTANQIEEFSRKMMRGSDHVRLENEDLIRLSGKAIAQVILLAADDPDKNYNQSVRKHLKKVARETPENWVKLASREFAVNRYAELTENQLYLVITPTDTPTDTPTEQKLTQAKILSIPEWKDIFADLHLMAVGSSRGVDLYDVYPHVAELLHTEFPRVFREALKQDFQEDGRAYAGLSIQLLTEIKKELTTQQKSSNLAIQYIKELQDQLEGTEQQIQAKFTELSQQINSGFAELCQRFGIVETNINQTLQGLSRLQDSVDQVQDSVNQSRDEILNRIDNLEVGVSQGQTKQFYQALLEFDYQEQSSLFDSVLSEHHRFGAFLIHGFPNSEHRWLHHRFIKKVSINNPATKISDNLISMIPRGQIASLSELWKSIHKDLIKGGSRPSSQSLLLEINKTLIKRWETQTVILSFDIKGCTSEYINDFLKEFWIPLAKLAERSKPQRVNTRLLVFLIDSQQCRGEDIYSSNCQESDPSNLIRLAEIKPLSRNQLCHCLDVFLRKIEASEGKIDTIVRDILNRIEGNIDQQSNYDHASVLEKICNILYDTNWDELRKKWTKY